MFLGFLSLVLFGSARAFEEQPDDLLFQIGRPDASPSEFGRSPNWQRLMPKDHDPKQPIAPYATDRKYWELLWHQEETGR